MTISEIDSAALIRHRLILVCEQDAQHKRSGSRDRLEEIPSVRVDVADWSASRARMEILGVVYRMIAATAPEVEVRVLDPRNWTALYPLVWKDARAHRLSAGDTVHAIVGAGAPVAVVLDGRILYSGRLPDSDAIVDAVRRRLHDRVAFVV